MNTFTIIFIAVILIFSVIVFIGILAPEINNSHKRQKENPKKEGIPKFNKRLKEIRKQQRGR
jgi:hypothetical protein